MVPEAKLVPGQHGLVPEGEGWFVLNAREAEWKGGNGLGAAVTFEGDVRFPAFGVNLQVLNPGEPNCMYHGEGAQEDFLVLAGECLLIVEGEERPLRPWDFVRRPAWTEHVFVGAGDGPCVVAGVGARTKGRGVRYLVNDTAARYGAAVEEETSEPSVAYARFAEDLAVPCPDGFPP